MRQVANNCIGHEVIQRLQIMVRCCAKVRTRLNPAPFLGRLSQDPSGIFDRDRVNPKVLLDSESQKHYCSLVEIRLRHWLLRSVAVSPMSPSTFARSYSWFFQKIKPISLPVPSECKEVTVKADKDTRARSLSCLITIFLFLSGAGLAGAQTQSGPVQKVPTGTITAKLGPGSPTGKPAPINPNTDPVKYIVTSSKSDAVSTAAEGRLGKDLAPPAQAPAQCKRTINADVIAIPQAIMLNRLGAAIPDGLIFALKSNVDGPANRLLADKRPRPLVLRANVGDCLKITLTNSIPVTKFTTTIGITTDGQVASTSTTELSLHVQGMEWVTGPQDDGSFVGVNATSLVDAPGAVPPPPQRVYTLYAKNEGAFLLYTTGDSALGGQLGRGLFGALNIQPEGAEWYRSQVTADDLLLATYNEKNPQQVPPGTLNCPTPANCIFTLNGKPTKVIRAPGGYLHTPDHHPLIDYDAVYTATRADGVSPVPPQEVGVPILKMLDANNNIVHSDLTAIITGPKAGRFPGTTGPDKPEPPCNAENNPNLKTAIDPLFCANPASPDRKQPYREITILYHDVGAVASQAFPIQYTNPMTLNAGFDGFAINYGTGGIGAEVYANRIGVGAMGDCVDCKFEEFFLSAWAVGDPAMLVDKPANSNSLATNPQFQPPCANVASFNSPPCGGQRSSATEPYKMTPEMKAKVAFFPDDPSNVYHSYINDHTKFRILHGGAAVAVTHVHHQHAHQWLQSPNSDESSYLDSQMISPGSSYTLEMVYNGSGNRNKVVGDSIFHCHFYPHFAAGMWAMWRTHDVFESGTFVFPKSGEVVPGSRALPDGEITAGSPTPAIVPLPTIPMAPLPGYAQIQNNVDVQGLQTHFGGQVVIGGKCGPANTLNGLTVIGGCNPGEDLRGTVISSQFNGTQMTGEFLKSKALVNPGFPFYIPGIAGARAPHPPLDFAPDGSNWMDGGLPRHLVGGGWIAYERHTEFDWSKDLDKVTAAGLPETGTDVELAAIKFFSQRCHKTFLPDGTAADCLPAPTPFGFIVNGLPRKNPAGNAAEKLGATPGAPFADPAVNDLGHAVGLKRRYKAAAFQIDVVFNKKGWHFPQQRMLSLWEDVLPTVGYKPGTPGVRKPEPLFFRGNSGDIIEYWHTNLVPNYYLVDDFQVRTPTDILGQHIHLVKFDVTSSDGAGNGFNYEDGTFSPQDVQDMIRAINKGGGLLVNNQPVTLQPKMPPKEIIDCSKYPNDERCKPCENNWTPTYRPQCQSWMGAQTTIQRWYLDPLVDDSGVDRTMRTVFTHDHFGPSTHQQAGLYAGLLIEPRGSTWKNSEDGSVMGHPANLPPIRPDGGPTSWKADIITGPNNYNASYREFALEFQDLQLAYAAVSMGSTTPKPPANPDPSIGWRDPVGTSFAINPARNGSNQVRPRLISTGNSPPTGTHSVNYLNDPIPWRVGQFGDLSYAYDNAFKLAPNAPPNGDPSTPLLRAYQNDNVQIRILVGAHVFAHQFNLEGPTWFAEPSWKNSGYRSAQPMGLSEHFELLFKVPSSSAPNIKRKCPDGMSTANCVDYLYSPSLDETGVANGMWGLFRSYDPTVSATKLQPLPNNPINPNVNVSYSTCGATLLPPAVKRVFNVAAVTAQHALANVSPVPGSNPKVGEIVFNSRGARLTNSNGVMYVRTEDLDSDGRLKPGVPIEPLILRANAGDCIEVNLVNVLFKDSTVFTQNFQFSPPFSTVPVQNKMSSYVGLHPQLLSYDAATSYGFNVGWNSQGQPNQVVGFGSQPIKYTWYAGKIERKRGGKLVHTPVEFGALNLFPSDPVFQNINGLIASMIIEPQGSKWKCGEDASLADCDPGGGPPPTSRASATVTLPNNSKFREFALMISDNMIIKGGDSGAVNYRTEPRSFRYGCGIGGVDLSCMKSDQLIQKATGAGNPPPCNPVGVGPVGDPQTPVFTAAIGDTVRFRMTHPFGTGTSQVFTVHGHAWQRNPYTNDSKVIGSQSLSQWLGSRDNHGSTDHFELVINKAGGEWGRAGDYLYSVFVPNQQATGAWGVFRVGPKGSSVGTPACNPESTAKPYTPPGAALERFIRTPVNKPPVP